MATFTEIVQSPNDNRIYRHICLDNGLRALLISDLNIREDDSKNIQLSSESDIPPNQKLSSAALCIGVGSFSDPPDIPGFAHFLEHMVFMGSEKYPDENEFDKFTSKHGGSTNAYTDNEETVFYFDIAREHFFDGLDRFAQFFIKPLMKKDAIDRELQAVDSEFEMSMTNDTAKKQQLLSNVAHDGHPMGKFTMGSTETLKTIPLKENINVYERLQAFHQRLYSSHFMTLAVISKDTLDNLEKHVREIFSAVPNNHLERPQFTNFPLPFDTKSFHRLYQAIPVKNKHCLEINWQLPSMMSKYKEKPLSYLDFIIGHEGKGTILSYLKKKSWALELEAGTSYYGFEFNSIYSLFSINIEMTPLGIDHIPEILTVVFQYLNKMRNDGPSVRIFHEMKKIEDNLFRWREQEEPYEYVEKVCHWMQSYPLEHVLTGSSLFYDFDSDLINSITKELVPEKARLFLFSRKGAENCTLTEKWYKTLYTVSDIPDEWELSWKNLQLNDSLHLPAENEFISSDFMLVSPYTERNEHPVKIKESGLSIVWYKKDDKFKVPKAYFYVLFKSDFPNSNAFNAACFDLYIELLKENLSEVAYAANAAQLNYSIDNESNGLVVKVSGFNDKLPKLFSVIIDHISNFSVSQELFETVKDKTKRYYANKAIKPEYLCRELRFSITRKPYWSIVDKQNCLLSLSYEQFVSFPKSFCSKLLIESLYQGNLKSDEVLKLDQMILDKLKCDELPSIRFPITRVLNMESSELYCRVKNFNQEDKNSVITNYYQYGIANIRSCTLTDLMMLHMEEPCFDILRTKKQLGYSVYCIARHLENIIGCSITVCSQATKFNMEELYNHMKEFLETFKNMSAEMTEDEFNKLVKSLITLKTCEDTCLEEEVDRNWHEVITERYVFDKIQKEVAFLKSVKIEELKQWVSEYFTNMLSCQVVGNGFKSNEDAGDVDMQDENESNNSDDDDDDDDNEEDEDVEKMDLDDTINDRISKLEFLPTESNIENISITDISKFQNKFALYSNSKTDLLP